MANNPLRQDVAGSALRTKLQGLGAGTYDPEFMKQFRGTPATMNPGPSVPFIPAPNPAENKSQLIKKRMLLYSGDRDDRVGSTPSDFLITLNSALDEVVKIELRSFQCPAGVFNIDGNNSTINFGFDWTRANSPALSPGGSYPPPAYPQINATLTVLPGVNQVSIAPGSYTAEQLGKAWVSALNENINYWLTQFPIPGNQWISGQVNQAGKLELYSVDSGLLFTVSIDPTQAPAGVAMGFPVGTYTAINTGGVYGNTQYYYLVAPNKISLKDYSIICVQSIALGNNLIATEGGSAGFNAFTTIPVSDSTSPILVRFDTTLDSSYFEPSRTAYNSLKNIDIKITDKDGFLIPFTEDIIMEFDVVQKIKPGTQGT